MKALYCLAPESHRNSGRFVILVNIVASNSGDRDSARGRNPNWVPNLTDAAINSHPGKRMTVIICPGVHPPELTEHFLSSLGGQITDYLIFPSDSAPPYSALHVFDFLQRQFSIPHPIRAQCYQAKVPLLFIGFSAGVVGAIGAAWLWQVLGRTVKAFVALDGWGVPLYGNFPIYRLSHDAFTHYSSALLSQRGESFYADPAVPHLELWRSPYTAQGWWLSDQVGEQPPAATTAAEFLTQVLAHYQELSPLDSYS